MEITLNGEKYSLDAPVSVTELLARFGVDARAVAVERNLAIVPKSLYAATPLANGDRLEIVGFVGGG